MGKYVVSLHQPGVYRNGKAVIYTLYDTESGDSDFILNSTLKLEVNKAGSFEFDILPSHSCYSILRRYIQYVSIKEYRTFFQQDYGEIEIPEGVIIDGIPYAEDIDLDGETTAPMFNDLGDTQIVFYGRILSMNLSFNGTKHIVCEGLMANLLDCPMYKSGAFYTPMTQDKLFTISGTPANMFSTGINAYRNLIRTDIYEGVVHNEANSYTFDDIDVSGGTSVGDFISGELVEAHGGYLNMRYRELGNNDIVGFLYWDPDPSMSSYDRTAINQTISFGDNLLDLSGENEDDEIATGIIPMWEDSQNNKKWTSTIGYDVDHADSFQIYKPYVAGVTGGLSAIGLKIVELPGCKNQETALNYASTYVSKYCNYNLSTVDFDSYTVRAIDFHYLNDDNKNRIWLYDQVRIVCEPHGIDKTLMCTSIEILLDNPENSSYTFSVFRPKASSNDKTLTRQLKKGTRRIYK